MLKSAASEFNLPRAATLPFDEPALVIYKITNKKNGSAYIGLTKHGAKKRLSKHWRERFRHDTALSRALIKYGREAFSIEILALGLSEKGLRELEIKLIAEHKTYVRDGGYNMTRGGDGLLGASPETLEKMRAVTTKRMADPAVRLHISKTNKGRKHTAEAKLAIAAASRGRIKSAETIAKLSRPRAGFPPDWRENISKAKRGKPVPDSVLAAATAANTGRPRPEAVKQKISETKRARRDEISARSKASWARRRAVLHP